MSWFFPARPGRTGPDPFDTVIAQNIEAQRRSAQAAEGVAQAADQSRESVEATVGAFKVRTAERYRHRRRTHLSSEVREAVEATLRRMDERAQRGEERSQ